MPELPGDISKPDPSKQEEKHQFQLSRPSVLRKHADRLVRAIKGVFSANVSRVDESSQRLAGRIHELHTDTDEVCLQLLEIKADLTKELDEELFEAVTEVIEPLLRDVRQIQNSLKRQGTGAHQVKAVQRYRKWVEHAKLWVHLYSRAKDKEEVMRGVVRHIMLASERVLDRDLQVIEDYQQHCLDEVKFGPDKKAEMLERFSLATRGFLKQLKALKHQPKGVALSQISTWKEEVDRERQTLFDMTLQCIDEILAEEVPNAKIKEEHAHLVEIFSEIAYLEEQVFELLENIQHNDLSDRLRIQELVLKAEILRERADLLHADLRVPPEHVESLENLLKHLEEIEDMLSS